MKEHGRDEGPQNTASTGAASFGDLAIDVPGVAAAEGESTDRVAARREVVAGAGSCGERRLQGDRAGSSGQNAGAASPRAVRVPPELPSVIAAWANPGSTSQVRRATSPRSAVTAPSFQRGGSRGRRQSAGWRHLTILRPAIFEVGRDDATAGSANRSLTKN